MITLWCLYNVWNGNLPKDRSYWYMDAIKREEDEQYRLAQEAKEAEMLHSVKRWIALLVVFVAVILIF